MYWSEQSFTGLWPEDWCSPLGLQVLHMKKVVLLTARFKQVEYQLEGIVQKKKKTQSG